MNTRELLGWFAAWFLTATAACAEGKVFPLSAINSESGHRKMLAEAFPGLEFGFYHWSGRMMIGALEDFDHDRVLLFLEPAGSGQAKFSRNGELLQLPPGEAVTLKVSGMTHPADGGPPVDDLTRTFDWQVGYWIKLVATDKFSMVLDLEYPDKGRFQADYDPDAGWQMSSHLEDGARQGKAVVPADVYEISRTPLLAQAGVSAWREDELCRGD